MARARQVSRDQQYAALYLGSQLEEDRRRYFLGSAKVDVDRISFNKSLPREINAQNVQRLMSSFELTGCLQLDPQHHLPAVIPPPTFREAVSHAGSTSEEALDRNPSRWPRVSFPPDFQIQCLRGKHCIEVAKQYLTGRNRWWVVDFYSEDLSNDLQTYLANQTSNEQPLSPGEIYFHILRCDPSDTRTIKSWWAQIQSPDEVRELKRLLAREKLNAPFRALAKMPAFGRGLLAGCIGGMLRLKCDEEIIHYLTHVYETWSFLFGHNDDAMQRLDAQTVESLESRIPARSLSDESFLRPLVEQGAIFESFTPFEREHIWRNLKLYPRRVPSIRLFLKDLLYLETLVACVKKLVQPGRRQTVFEALRQSFVGPGLQQPVSAETDVEGLHFEKSYRKLYLFAMGHLEPLRPGSVLLEKGEARQTAEKDPQAWYDFAQEAHQRGFRSQSITDILSHSADRDAARATLMRVRNPAVFVYEEAEIESFINQMVTIFNQARRRDPLEEAPSLVCDGSGEEIRRRSGRPFRKAFEESSKFLTYDNIHMRDIDEAGELTPFFIRRDVYLSFFGPIYRIDHSESEAMGMGPSTPNTPEPEPETGDNVHSGLEELVRRDEVLENQTANEIHPTTGSRDSGDGPERPLHSPISSSHYSRSSEEFQDMTPEENSPDLNQPLDGPTIQFISLGGSRPEVVEEVVISGAADLAVEAVATRYASRGTFLFNRQLRSVAPPQCLEVALEDEEQAIFVIPENRSTLSAASLLESSGLKRPASDELISNRPRKMHIT